MRKIRKLLALLLVAVITVTAVSVTSFASPYDEAIAIDSGETVEGTIDPGESIYYEITTKSSGTLTVTWSYGSIWSCLYVYDEDGAYIPVETLEIKAGRLRSGGEGEDSIEGKWSGASEKFSVTSTYKVTKGTYYIQCEDGSSYSKDGDHKSKLTVTYPTEEKEVKISYLGLTMKKGDTLQLSAILTGGKEKTTWTSSKKKVASITSSGKVTAKKKGSTIITAKCGDSVVKLKITVK